MKIFRALCAVVVFGLLGCGGGGSNPPTSADFCAQYAKNICGISAVCGITTTSCETYQKAQCNATAAAAVTGGKRVFAPGNQNNCLNKVKAAYNGMTVITPKVMADIDLACGYVFQGTGKVLNDTCTTQFECGGATDGSIICDKQLGVCATKKTVNGGDPCNGVGDLCPQDYTCTPNSASILVCTAAAKMGQSCAATSCDHTSRCVGGTCAALAQSGEACTVNADCASTAPYCNPYLGATPVCSAGLLVGNGTSCTCIGQGVGCPTGTTTGTAGAGGSSTGAAGAAGGAGGPSTGAAGSAGGAAGGTTGAAGAAGGAAGGSAGAAGTPGSAGAGGAGGLASDSTGVGGI